MAITTTQGFVFKLVANGEILDVFSDEEIKLSDNVTGLFDLGVLPTDFTRQITLPGTKKNNAFFEHVYDISVFNPDIFATNIKVPAYLDFDGLYLAQGYLQLNKVNVIANKFIDSYEITIFGALASFGKTINRYFLTDLTNLSEYDHTASFNNISASWAGNLFNGDIVYPLAEYGTKLRYTTGDEFFGIDDSEGALTVQDFKPAIRVKALWDKIFEFAGVTYSGSFWNQPFVDDIYLVCNNSLKYPEFTGVDLETFGLIKISPTSGSNQTDLVLTKNLTTNLPWYNIDSNPSNTISPNLSYKVEKATALRGVLNLEVQLSGSIGGPAIELIVRPTGSSAPASLTTLVNFNQYFSANTFEMFAEGANGQNKTYSIQTEFLTAQLPVGEYNFAIKWYDQFATPYNNFTFKLDPNGKPKSYLQITKALQAADNRIMSIAPNLPYGTNGIKLVDFIRGVQKKFNLIIYPSKTQKNEFIVETFNNWYNAGEIKDFNKYINLDEKIEVIPANNLAVNELNFGDTLDQDYISQQFSKAANREYGKQYYVDTQNFFSQGKFEVKTTLASAPLIKIDGTGVSGSVEGLNPPAPFSLVNEFTKLLYGDTFGSICDSYIQFATYTQNGTIFPGYTLYRDAYGSQPVVGYPYVVNPVNNLVYPLNQTTGVINTPIQGELCF